MMPGEEIESLAHKCSMLVKHTNKEEKEVV